MLVDGWEAAAWSMVVSAWTLVVIEAMLDDSTASNSRKSASWRERSRGRVSRQCVYSVNSASEYNVCALEFAIVRFVLKVVMWRE